MTTTTVARHKCALPDPTRFKAGEVWRCACGQCHKAYWQQYRGRMAFRAVRG